VLTPFITRFSQPRHVCWLGLIVDKVPATRLVGTTSAFMLARDGEPEKAGEERLATTAGDSSGTSPLLAIFDEAAFKFKSLLLSLLESS
jgi:hypothetical protein